MIVEQPFNQNLTYSFKNAAYNYNYDQLEWETMEFGDSLEIIRNYMKKIGIKTNHRDCCSFWQWHSEKVDASFLEVGSGPESWAVAFHKEVAEFITKYDN